ncbi:MAG: tRNA preQ1(34) S-adenosylmethionine ribosyltransferase-isomerase QueA [Candidatus Omnitrophota bacterium]|nr:tRNA preQ1(34) S-adenosylmethionine ribosyltransferase-isomerase QueA [Candidatus Omnitrophota bacterium]
MLLSDFDYQLPEELIAQYPLSARDQARLLILDRRKESIEHRLFRDLPDYLRQGDLLLLNDTKVLQCRLKGKKKTGGKAEVLLLKDKGNLTFRALVKPSRLKVGEEIIFSSSSGGGKISGVLSDRNEITFRAKDAASIYASGIVPLPPYIKREPEELDKSYYQTVYASKPGAVAAPTAGLHFTAELIEKIKSSGVNLAYLTLHVGYGTFRPVKADDIRQHSMEPEYFEIPPATAKEIEALDRSRSRIIAVGTTSLRALESYAQGQEQGSTDLFIYPGYKFRLADCLLTNFHLPRSTLFILVSAFCAAGASASGGAGFNLVKKAYQEAVERKYRFYSYGDAMLIV